MYMKNENLQKDNLILNITDLDMNAKGIAHNNEDTFFVENALIGEVVEAKILNSKKNLINCKAVEILNKSEKRINPLCPYFNECGGCDTQHIKYEETFKFKKQQILLLLKKIANVEYKKDIEIVKSENEYFYRNKLTMQVKEDNTLSKLCYYKKNSHSPIFVENCYIVNKKFKIVINLVNEFFKNNNISSYNEKTKKGNIKHIVARIIDDNLLLTFVTYFDRFENVNDLYLNLQKHFKNVGINLNINKNNNEILSINFKHLIGIKEIIFSTLNVKQNITNASFLQVNFDIQNKLYNYVINNISENVVNAYSGAGLLTALMAKNSNIKTTEEQNVPSSVIGIEINREATKLADKLMEENDIKNVKNICGDASVILKDIPLKNFTLVLDPPRSGVSDEVIKAIINKLPNKIIYISCSLNSLCKNLKELLTLYEISEIKGFDMFPQTRNLETVVILTKK